MINITLNYNSDNVSNIKDITDISYNRIYFDNIPRDFIVNGIKFQNAHGRKDAYISFIKHNNANILYLYNMHIEHCICNEDIYVEKCNITSITNTHTLFAYYSFVDHLNSNISIIKHDIDFFFVKSFDQKYSIIDGIVRIDNKILYGKNIKRLKGVSNIPEINTVELIQGYNPDKDKILCKVKLETPTNITLCNICNHKCMQIKNITGEVMFENVVITVCPEYSNNTNFTIIGDTEVNGMLPTRKYDFSKKGYNIKKRLEEIEIIIKENNDKFSNSVATIYEEVYQRNSIAHIYGTILIIATLFTGIGVMGIFINSL